MPELTTVTDLERIARKRNRVFSTDKYEAVCSDCGATLSVFGLIHWEDCEASDAQIKFKSRSLRG